MKLVELLAKELAEWPGDAALMAQDGDTWIGGYSSPPSLDEYNNWMGKNCVCAVFSINEHPLATDHATAIVTREMWEDERGKNSWHGPFSPPDGSAVDMDLFFPSAKIYLGGDPRRNRDRIREIDKQLADLEAERAERVAELAAEGFALIAVAVDPS